jgi:hypothetical protein
VRHGDLQVREPLGERVQHGHRRVHVCAPSATWSWRDWTATVSETSAWSSCAYTCSVGRGWGGSGSIAQQMEATPTQIPSSARPRGGTHTRSSPCPHLVV